ncbi:MAG: sugar kinase [Candidatus Aminicenantes bacterium]|nr:sugar kinase [Candidatus Aminicenantes bacterium]
MAKIKIPLTVLGDVAWDVLVRPNSPLLPGGDVFGEITIAPGGCAANTAVWAVRCGLKTSFIGKIGSDRFGLMAKENLEHEKVAAHLVYTDKHHTATVAVWINREGERSTVFGQGADYYLLASELPAQKLKKTNHLHLTAWSLFSDPPRAAAYHAAGLVKEMGGTISLDPASFQMIDQAGKERSLEYFKNIPIDLFFPNLAEGKLLSGEDLPEKVISKLSELFPSAIIILKLGANGALIRQDEQTIRIKAAVDSIIDSTGAGDSFTGAFLAKFLTGVSPVQAGTFAVKISSWVVNHVGAQPGSDKDLRSIIKSFIKL